MHITGVCSQQPVSAIYRLLLSQNSTKDCVVVCVEAFVQNALWFGFVD